MELHHFQSSVFLVFLTVLVRANGETVEADRCFQSSYCMCKTVSNDYISMAAVDRVLQKKTDDPVFQIPVQDKKFTIMWIPCSNIDYKGYIGTGLVLDMNTGLYSKIADSNNNVFSYEVDDDNYLESSFTWNGSTSTLRVMLTCVTDKVTSIAYVSGDLSTKSYRLRMKSPSCCPGVNPIYDAVLMEETQLGILIAIAVATAVIVIILIVFAVVVYKKRLIRAGSQNDEEKTLIVQKSNNPLYGDEIPSKPQRPLSEDSPKSTFVYEDVRQDQKQVVSVNSPCSQHKPNEHSRPDLHQHEDTGTFLAV